VHLPAERFEGSFFIFFWLILGILLEELLVVTQQAAEIVKLFWGKTSFMVSFGEG
jgi:hypothetical protein